MSYIQKNLEGLQLISIYLIFTVVNKNIIISKKRKGLVPINYMQTLYPIVNLVNQKTQRKYLAAEITIETHLGGVRFSAAALNW